MLLEGAARYYESPLATTSRGELPRTSACDDKAGRTTARLLQASICSASQRWLSAQALWLELRCGCVRTMGAYARPRLEGRALEHAISQDPGLYIRMVTPAERRQTLRPTTLRNGWRTHGNSPRNLAPNSGPPLCRALTKQFVVDEHFYDNP